MLSSLLDLWSGEESFLKITTNINKNHDYRAAVTGLDGSARVYFMAALACLCRRPALIVTADAPRAEKIYTDLQAFLPDQVNLLPPRELFMNSEVISRSGEYQQMRMRFFEWLYEKGEGIYVAPLAALISKVLPLELWSDLITDLQPGQHLDRQDLITQLIDKGYERATLTETGGQFSARGDIIDIFPTGRPEPIRLELFEDTIESIRSFDPATQRSNKKMQHAAILPARELVLSAERYKSGETGIMRSLEQALSRMRRRGENDTVPRLKNQVGRHLERLAQPDGLDLLSNYFPFFYGRGASLTDYLPADFLVIIEEPAALNDYGQKLRRDFENHSSNSIIEGDLLAPGDDLLWQEDEIFSSLPCPLVGCSLFPGTGGLYQSKDSYPFAMKGVPSYHGQWDIFISDLHFWQREGQKVIMLAGSEQRGRGLMDLLADNENISALPVLTGNLDEGFVIPALQLAVVTEQNLFPGRRKKRRITKGEGIRLSDYRELAVGDYVVHEQHGIGKYNGLITLEIAGIKRDYLLLKYRGTDKLYIPVEQVGLIQKHSGGEGPAPRLHSLGGGEWQRLKNRVNLSVEELARDLLALYAARQAVEGYSYGPDHLWQQEFEAQFSFEETPDQLKAVSDVKADLEKSHPMDRLICGDVGYGKTEVAMRAAFKVVADGKQVAILVPTTILAQQHYRTFRERFSGFPIRVAQLSRFIPPAEQKELIKEIAAGKVDIIIGTHRLLSRDIRFRDLGLLVIDEEQRFGVRQKEKMKRLRLEVDTLSMTATPIPRTLHLSLTGARDLSIIDTPPEDRYPIQTYVLEYSENLVREAIQRELSRQGQVYIVFNRVERIDIFAEQIQKLFPDATVAVGHGQLPEKALEKIMADFQEGRYQILVSTTIIESGLDIPNVNTLIVYEADKFGLAQLYQIRGRVGRSNRLAYAYLTYRKDKVVSETAKKRLRAIKEFTELGSGFKIALRDLEIRGVGNILGAEQHGFINAVGFDLYVKLLDQAVAELKNEKHEQMISPRLDLQVSAYLPSTYIIAQDQKIDFYQRIYNAASVEELKDLDEELNDRYGILPEPVDLLLQVAKLRITAAQLGVELIQQKQGSAVMQFSPSAPYNQILLRKDILTDMKKITVSSSQPLILKIKEVGRSIPLLDDLAHILAELSALQQAAVGSSKAV